MGLRSGEAIIGGAIGYGLWWLVRLAPFVDLDVAWWLFALGGTIGAVLLSQLAEEGPRKTFLPFVFGGLALAGVVAFSWGGGRLLQAFPALPSWVLLVCGFVLLVVAVNVWDAKQRRGRPPELPSDEEGPEPNPKPDGSDIPGSNLRGSQDKH